MTERAVYLWAFFFFFELFYKLETFDNLKEQV